jgi:hypothetical protein
MPIMRTSDRDTAYFEKGGQAPRFDKFKLASEGEGGAKIVFLANVPRNWLKSLDSDEGMKGNSRKFKDPPNTNASKTTESQENSKQCKGFKITGKAGSACSRKWNGMAP